MGKAHLQKSVMNVTHGDRVTTPFLMGRQPPGKKKMWQVDALFPLVLDGQIDIASIDEGSAALLHGLVRALMPNFVLETGTHKGRSTRAIATALADNNNGAWMVTVDKDDYGTLQDAVGDVADRVHQIVGECPGALDEVQKVMHERDVEVIDFAFLDGGHEANVLQAELEFVEFNRAEECWVVVDNSRDVGWPDVRDVMDVWAAKYPAIQLETCCGFDILWMR